MKKRCKIFLSYVRQDLEKIEQIYDQLARAGFQPWMDTRDVLGGQLWRPNIEKAIRTAKFFLVFLSKRSVSKRGYLQKEIRDALEILNEKLPSDIFLIPVRLENCKVPERLAELQWIDLFEENGWAQLVKALEAGTTPRKPARAGPGVRSGTRRPVTAPLRVEARSDRSPERPVIAGPAPVAKPVRAELPVITFPEELHKVIERFSPQTWRSLDEETRRFVINLGTKLEPIVQIVRPTPVPVIMGFESLALGSLGENFREICAKLPDFDPGLLRLLLMLAAMKTASLLRVSAAEAGNSRARHLLFTINLDPETLDCPYLDKFLEIYRHHWDRNVLFEINEQTSSRYLGRLNLLQSDFRLRFCADDFNNWSPAVKIELRNRVELTKLDFRGFQEAMAIRGDDPQETVDRIAMNLIPGKPLVVEGIEDENHLRFLEGRWPFGEYGELFGQGYSIEPGLPWETWTSDLRGFGFPGGHILTGADRPAEGPWIARERSLLSRLPMPMEGVM